MLDNTSLFAISCGVVLAGFLAWRKRRSFGRLKALLSDLWYALPQIWPILKKKRVLRWRWRRKPKSHRDIVRDSDILEETEDIPDDEPPEERRKSA